MQRFRAIRRIHSVFGPALLALLVSGCGLFCPLESYTTREMVPVYLQVADIDKIESLAPQDILEPGKIYLHNDLILVNELDKGVHVFDNRDPTNPVNLAFIAIPGNHDLLVREEADSTLLYADNYSHLVVLDISDPTKVQLRKRLEDVFSAFYPQPEDDSQGFLAGYEEGEVVTYSYRNCGGRVADAPPPSSNPGGVSQGGSLARFAALGRYLYTIDGDAIQSFSLATPADPVVFNRVSVAFGIETLFPYRRESGDQLYVGGNQGMYIMDARDPANLRKQGEIAHVQSCDPVVVQDDLAYVTLQGSCFGESNRLEIIDVSEPSAPALIIDYALQEPYGLGIDGDYLFVCDGAAGLKVYANARRPKELSLIKQLDRVSARDVIPVAGIALVIAQNGLFQYDYSDLAEGELTLLSSIPISERGD